MRNLKAQPIVLIYAMAVAPVANRITAHNCAGPIRALSRQSQVPVEP
jgi:hypothetical protein